MVVDLVKIVNPHFTFPKSYQPTFLCVRLLSESNRLKLKLTSKHWKNIEKSMNTFYNSFGKTNIKHLSKIYRRQMYSTLKSILLYWLDIKYFLSSKGCRQKSSRGLPPIWSTQTLSVPTHLNSIAQSTSPFASKSTRPTIIKSPPYGSSQYF